MKSMNNNNLNYKYWYLDGGILKPVDSSWGLTINGTTKFQSTTDATDFFQVLDADGGTPILNVDTVNERVGIGTDTPAYKLDILDATNPQLRLTNDETYYTDIQTTSSNDVVVTPAIFSDGSAVDLTDELPGDSVFDLYASETRVWTFGLDDSDSDSFKISTSLDFSTGNALTITTAGKIGIGEIAPETLLELSSTVPYITLHNSTAEDTDGGRESRINFKGEQSGGEETTLARIEVSHDGTADDEKGKVVISTNAGSDGDTPTTALTIDSAQKATFAGEIYALGDISASTNGSNTTTPRVFGYKDLTSGEACRFQFGDNHNGLQNAYAGDVTLYSYWGLVLAGGMQNYSSGFVPPAFTTTTDVGVLILSTNDIGDDPGAGATNIVTCAIKAVASQTNDLLQWRASDNSVLADISASGRATFPEAEIGDGTNYANFASDGELTLVGTARVKKEFGVTLTDFNPGASGPTMALHDIFPTYEFTINDDMHTSFELPTDWETGTDITIEVYWAIDEAYATNSGEVRWSADWRAVAVGEVISAGASGTCDFGDVNIPATANTVAKTECTISGASLAMDDLIAFNGMRVALVAGANPTAEPYIVSVRVEYTSNKLGTAL